MTQTDRTLKLKIGDQVILRDDSGGQLDGVVTSFERDGNVAVITPDSGALRAWYPQGYTLGRAHWPARLSLRVQGPERATDSVLTGKYWSSGDYVAAMLEGSQYARISRVKYTPTSSGTPAATLTFVEDVLEEDVEAALQRCPIRAEAAKPLTPGPSRSVECICHNEPGINHESCCGHEDGRSPDCPIHGDGGSR